MKYLLLFTFSLFLTACFDQAAEDSANNLVSNHNEVQNEFTVYLSANKTYAESETIQVILNHPFNVNVSGTPRIQLDIGGATEFANYSQGNGTQILIFSYQVQNGDLDLDGIDIGSTVDLNGGELKFSYQGVIDDANTSLGTISSSGIKVDATATLTPTQLAIINQPTDAYQNSNISPAITVEIRDASNTLVTSSTAAVTLSFAADPSSGSATLSGTTTVNAVNGVATFSDINIDLINAGYSFSFTATGLTSATSNTFNITAAPATQLSFASQPTDADAGVYIAPDITVEILDGGGSLDTSATDTVTLAFGTNAGSGTLSGTLSVAAVAGVATFNDITIDKAASGYTLVASATGLTSDTSNTFTINPGAAASLDFVQQPSNTDQNTVISPDITVEILDAYGNRTANTDSITLSINNNPSAGTLSGTLSVNAVAGLATFNDLEIDNYGVGYTLDANATGLTGTTSSSFTINDITPTVTIDALSIINLANYTAYTVTGTCSENGRTVTLDIGGVAATPSCSSNTYTTGAIDVSAAADNAALAVTADHDNAIGMNATQASSTILKDTVAPSISTNTISAQTYNLNDDLTYVITFDENVTVSGTPRVQLNFDAQATGTIYADYDSGSTTTSLNFIYTIAAGDADSDGITTTSPLDLNSGTIVDAAGNPADLTFTPSDFSAVLVDSDVPSIVEFIEPVDGTYPDNVDLNFQVNFDENVIVTGTPRLAINVGGNTRYATYSSGSGTSGLEFAYTVQAGESDLDGITMVSNSIDLNSGTIKDGGGSDAALDFSLYIDSLTSVLVDANTGITPPDQVTGLATAPTSSNTTLALSWSVPNDNGTAITHYVVQYREQGNSTWINHSPNPSFNSTSINGLSEGVTYEFRVAANNGLLGPFSTTATAEIFDIASLNPIAWLSATDITNGGTEPSHNDKIASWSDLSGVASAATEANTANQPTYHTNVFNGLPAVRFDGHAQGLEGTFTRVNNGGLTVFLVAKMDANNPRKCLFEFYSDNGNQNDHRGFFFTYGMNEASSNYNLDDTTFNLWTAYDNGTHTDMWENGQVVFTNKQNWSGNSTAFTGAGAYVLGDDQTGGDEYNGYIAEFLIFDDALSAADQTKVETYLKNKWGTP